MVRTRSTKRNRRSGSGEGPNSSKKPCTTTTASEIDMASTSVSDLKAIIEESIEAALSRQLQHVAKSAEVQAIRDELGQVLRRQDALEGRLDNLEKKVADMEKAPLPPRVGNSINLLEQYTRRNSLRIRGIPEVPGETGERCIQDVVNFCRIKLGLELQPSSIDRAHRVGARKDNFSRFMLVKFVSWQDRNRIFRARAKLKGKKDDHGRPLLIVADLTKENHRIFTAALSAKKDNLIKDTWIDGNCRIMITLLDKNTKCIQSTDDLPSG